MAKTVANLNIQIGATTATLRRDLGNAQNAVRQFGRGATSAARGVNSLAASNATLTTVSGRMSTALVAAGKSFLFMAASAAAAAVSVRSLINRFSEIDKIAKTSAKLGVTTENLVGLREAAELTGVSASTLDMALQRMTRRISEAAAGSGEAQNAIKELGLSAETLNTAGPSEAFRQIADAMKAVEKPSDRLRLAFKLFDSEGAALVNTLSLGREALDEIQRSVEKTGKAFSDVDAQKVEDANDAIIRLRSSLEGLTNELAIAIAPAVEKAATALTELLKVINENKAAIDAFAKVGGFGLVGLFVSWTSGAEEAEEATEDANERLKETTAAIAAAVKESEKWAAVGQRISSSVKTPFATLKDAIDEASEALERGVISAEVYAQAVSKLKNDFRESTVAFKEATREAEKWASVGDKIRESVKTPTDKLRESLGEIAEAWRRGVIDVGTYAAAVRKVRDDLADLGGSALEALTPPSIGAAVRGTASGAAAVSESARALKDIALESRKELASAKRREKLLDLIYDELAEIRRKTVPVSVKEVAIL